MPESCLICMCRSREVRLQCGHLFACSDCARQCDSCAICRKPIAASYNVRPSVSHTHPQAACHGRRERNAAANLGVSDAASSSGAITCGPSGSGYMSSGSDSFKNTMGHDACYTSASDVSSSSDPGLGAEVCSMCNSPAELRLLSCPDACAASSLVCLTCSGKWACGVCHGSTMQFSQDQEPDPLTPECIRILDRSAEAHLTDAEGSQAWEVSKSLQKLIKHCNGSNSILELPEDINCDG